MGRGRAGARLSQPPPVLLLCATSDRRRNLVWTMDSVMHVTVAVAPVFFLLFARRWWQDVLAAKSNLDGVSRVLAPPDIAKVFL